MKKIFFSILFFHSLVLFSQELRESPQNPAFLNYLNNSKKSQFTEDDYPLSYFPPPVKYYFQKRDSKSIHSFPARFDLRDSAYVTVAKNQGNCGCCWAFSTLASLESNWLKNGFGSYDLSEENMKNCHGFEVGGCTSGNSEMADAYLTRGSGPLTETQNPYVAVTDSCIKGLAPVALITSSIYLPKDISVVKQAVMDYGGLYASLYWQNSSYNAANKTYYYKDTLAENHAVLIVGWNDNKNTAGGMGAWIAKNSWGTGWGEQGYFYISYNDKKVLTTVTCFPSKINYNNELYLYSYDKLGRTSDLGYSNPVAYGLVKFYVTAKQKLTKIGLVINTENTIVDVEVFSAKKNNQLLNRLSSVLNYTCIYPGYISFDLPEPVHFNAGEELYIKVKYNTPGNNYPLPFERFIADYANPEIEKGVCWVSSNGEAWDQFGSDIPSKARDLCIRAYMEPDTIFNESISDVMLYPNPSKGIVNIEFLYPEPDEINVDLYNIDGALLYPVQFTKGDKQIVQRLDFSNLAKGFYVMKMKSIRFSKEFKLIFL